jgi:hypothetical protein
MTRRDQLQAVRPWMHRTDSNMWYVNSTLYACLKVNLSPRTLSINFPVRRPDCTIEKCHVIPLSNALTGPFECPNMHGRIG